MCASFVFFNVDTQQDFFKDGLVDIPMSETILENLERITKVASEKGIKTVSSIRWFKEDSNFFSELPNYNDTYPKHCLKDTKGARFINQTAPDQFYLLNWESPNGLAFQHIHSNRNIVITKKVPELFEGNSFFESIIHNLGVPFMERPTFVVYGVDIGKTVLGLLKRGYTVLVVSDANVNLNGQPFKKEDIIPKVGSPDADIKPKEVLELNYITTKELIG
jgi:nicotinamidase-related amidase